LAREAQPSLVTENSVQVSVGKGRLSDLA